MANTNFKFKTNRGAIKTVIFSILTLGIYDIVLFAKLGEELNLTSTKYDGKKTMSFYLLFFLVMPLTFGLGFFVWFHKFSHRAGRELKRRNIRYSFGASSFWIWVVILGITIVGPFIYLHKATKAINLINKHENNSYTTPDEIIVTVPEENETDVKAIVMSAVTTITAFGKKVLEKIKQAEITKKIKEKISTITGKSAEKAEADNAASSCKISKYNTPVLCERCHNDAASHFRFDINNRSGIRTVTVCNDCGLNLLRHMENSF